MSAPLARTLAVVGEICRSTPVPVSTDEARELFDAVHNAGDALGGLHDDLAECLGPIDETGRCTDCGRLVARVHDQRGCMTAVPVLGGILWLLDNPESIPFIGKQLWLAKRRRAARKTSTVGAEPVRPPSAPTVGHAHEDGGS